MKMQKREFKNNGIDKKDLLKIVEVRQIIQLKIYKPLIKSLMIIYIKMIIYIQ